MISRAGLQFSARKVLVLPQPPRLLGWAGGAAGQTAEGARGGGAPSAGRKGSFLRVAQEIPWGKVDLSSRRVHPKGGGLLWIVV